MKARKVGDNPLIVKDLSNYLYFPIRQNINSRMAKPDCTNLAYEKSGLTPLFAALHDISVPILSHVKRGDCFFQVNLIFYGKELAFETR